MKKVQYVLMVVVMVFLSTITMHSQGKSNQTHFTALSVGDKIPNLDLSGFTGANRQPTNLYNFKTKLFVIDFWATWCGSCISSFPKLEKIKHQFEKDFNVLLVTDETENTVRQFNERRKRMGFDRLPFHTIYNDSLLAKLFPHESIPHYVWIDENGIIKAITAATELTVENAEAMILKKKIHLLQKNDLASEAFHDPFKPLFINGNGGDGHNIYWHSVLSGEVNGLQNAGVIMATDTGGMVSLANTDVYTLYKFAYGDDAEIDYMRLPNSRLLFNIKDSLAYFKNTGALKNVRGACYSYGLTTPKISMAALKAAMQEDLSRYFNLTAKWEVRTMKCLVLSSTDTTLIGPVSAEIRAKSGHGSSLYNYTSLNNPIRYFRMSLSENYFFYLPYPVIDETHYSGQTYFSIEANMNNWESVASALAPYQLHLTLEDREVKVLVVNENN